MFGDRWRLESRDPFHHADLVVAWMETMTGFVFTPALMPTLISTANVATDVSAYDL